MYTKRRQELAEGPLAIAQSFSLQAEHAVIGTIIKNPQEAFEELSGNLEAQHFYDPFCRAVYEMFLHLQNENTTVDTVVLASRLDGGLQMQQQEIIDKLNEIYMSYPAATNLMGWAGVIVDKYVDRNLAKTGQALAQMAHAQNLSRDDKLAEASRLISQAASSMSKDTVVTAAKMVYETIAMIEKFSENAGKITGLPTGLNELDALTSGFGPGDLIIIGARPAMGKTSFALSVAKHCCSVLPRHERKGVLMFSMEMGTTQIGMRWMAVRNNINIQHMKSGQITQSDRIKMLDELEESNHIPFFLEESGSVTVEKLAAIARKKHREFPLGLIVIDYLQLISDSGGKNTTKSERVGEISRALKQLARELGIPIIALSQLSRDLEKRQDKRPVMSDLRDSGAIEQDADVIMFVYRDEVYNPNSQDRGVGEVIIGKHRNGPTGVVRLKFNAPTTTFENL